MKRPLHERARELAGITEASRSKNLERVMKKLEKADKLGSADSQYILGNIWAIEPSSGKDLADWDGTDFLDDEARDMIAQAYRKDTKAGTKRPKA